MTKNTTKALLLLLLITAIVVVISGCASTSPSATVTPTPVVNASASSTPVAQGPPNFTTITPGVLKIPVDSTFPPMEWINTSVSDPQAQFQGFDMDLMRAMCVKLNVTPDFVTRPWTSILNDIETGQYDCSISSWSVYPERQQYVLFSDPYFQIQQTMVVRKDDNSITNWTDIVAENKTVAVQMSTTGEKVATNLTDGKGNKIKSTNVKSFEGGTDAYNELKKGTADVVINDFPVNLYEVQAYPGDFKFTGDKWPLQEPYAIIMNKNNAQLAVALNWAIAQVKADGTYDQIAKEYGLE